MHRYVRTRGARTVLVRVPPPLRRALERDGLLHMCAATIGDDVTSAPAPVDGGRSAAERDGACGNAAGEEA
jgi:hypothetical protein